MKLFKVTCEMDVDGKIETLEKLVTAPDFVCCFSGEFAEMQGMRDRITLTAIIDCGEIARQHERTLELQEKLSQCTAE